MQRLKDNIKHYKERLITASRKSKGRIKINRTEITRKQKWEEKQLNGYFKRQTREILLEMTCTWPRKENPRRERESL